MTTRALDGPLQLESLTDVIDRVVELDTLIVLETCAVWMFD